MLDFASIGTNQVRLEASDLEGIQIVGHHPLEKLKRILSFDLNQHHRGAV